MHHVLIQNFDDCADSWFNHLKLGFRDRLRTPHVTLAILILSSTFFEEAAATNSKLQRLLAAAAKTWFSQYIIGSFRRQWSNARQK